MKKILLLVCSLCLIASFAYGQNWNPTPMVITVPQSVLYPFDGSATDITFDLAGKGGSMYLVINSKLDASQKPLGVQNGFKGWHIVNGIDTTIYVSSGRPYTPGKGLKYPWDGHGNEKQYSSIIDSGKVPPGTYSYYIMGYDDKSSREIANSFIEMGHFQPPQGSRFYPYDPQTGALLANPLLAGKLSTVSGTGLSGHAFKFTIGDDPYDVAKITTTFCFGFKSGDVIPGKSISTGSLVFDPLDLNKFYFTKQKTWEFAATVTKWEFVPRGEAIQDAAWMDWTGRTEYATLGDNPGGAVDVDRSGMLVWQIDGKNPIQFPMATVIGLNKDDPTDEYFVQIMDEYYTANPMPQIDLVRNGGELTRNMQGPKPGLFYQAGDGSCLVELIDCVSMMNGSDKRVQSDGSGYVAWANSNGDWFWDKNAELEPKNPPQLWACVSYEPRNINDLRTSPSPADENGFMAGWLEFAGLYSVGPVTQDGTGIDYWRFGDDSFAAGGDNTQKKGNGWALGVGGQFDGLYTHNPMKAEPAWGDASYRAVCWFAWDSDGGVISSSPTAVEDAAPAAFTVAQNTPNPFNPTTTINFNLAKQGQVSVDVFNVAGQKVASLLNDTLKAGSHSVTWDASGVAAGVYFYTVKSGDFSKTMKMTLLK